MTAVVPELRKVFPRSDPGQLPSYVTDELFGGEQVVWSGRPTRWGLFRGTPFIVVLLVAAGLLAYMARGSGLGPVAFLVMAQSAQHGARALILPGLVAIYLGFLASSMRDPRSRWIYVATDRRLMTFFNGRILRQAGSEGLDRLRVIQGPEMRLRGLGDVVWQVIRGGEQSNESTGPDQGRHGFRGMPEPEAWRQRLIQWREEVRRAGISEAREFADQSRECRQSRHRTEGISTSPRSRTIAGGAHGMRITLPEAWVGKVGRIESVRPRLFGFELPIDRIRVRSSRPLHRAEPDWNFIDIAGRSGFGVRLRVGPGSLARSAEAGDEAARAVAGCGKPVQYGTLTGYRSEQNLFGKACLLNVGLDGDGFHITVTATYPPAHRGTYGDALDAVIESIRQDSTGGPV